MINENAIIRSDARKALSGKWGLVAATMFVYILISGMIQTVPILGPFIIFLLTGAFTLGQTMFFLAIARNDNPKLELIFSGFNEFGKALAAYLLLLVVLLFWTLLLIIPGIIMGLAYSMTFFIIADEPEISVWDAMKKSKVMMEGYKVQLMLLILIFFGWTLLASIFVALFGSLLFSSFIGLILLTVITFGTIILWLIPYMQVSIAKFYDEVKNEYISQQTTLVD
jgi:uncharacterized membrane protein